MSKQPTEPDDWSAQCEALVHAVRGAHAPTALDRARVRSALAHELAAAASSAPVAGGGAQHLAGSGLSRAARVKLAAVGLGVACALGGAAAFLRSGSGERTEPAPAAPQRTSPPATEPHVALAGSAAGSSAGEDAPELRDRPRTVVPTRPAPRRSAAAATPAKGAVAQRPSERATDPAVEDPAPAEAASEAARSGHTPQPDAPLQRAERVEDASDARAELELVARINEAVRESKPDAVLALCAEHERRWPHGTFEPEREGARAIASCAAKLRGADARARSFLASYPRTAMAARVREDCAPLLGPDASSPP